MIKILRPGFGKYKYFSAASGYGNPGATVNVFSGDALQNSDQVLWEGRSIADEISTSRAGSFGDKPCRNVQTNLTVRTGGVDLAKLISCEPYDANILFTRIKRTGSRWVQPDLEFGYSDYARDVMFFTSNAQWMSGSILQTDSSAPVWSRYWSSFRSGSSWQRNYSARNVTFHRAPSGHVVGCYWNLSVLNDFSYYWSLSGFYCVSVGNRMYYFNGTAWTTSYKQLSKSGTVSFAQDVARSLTVDPIGYLSLALGTVSSLSLDVGDKPVPEAKSQLIADLLAKADSLALKARDAYFAYCDSPSSDDWAELAATSIDNMQVVNVNSPMLIKELVETGLGLLHLVKGDFSSLPDSLQSAWLSGRYGIRLTMSDLKDVIKAVHNELVSTYEPSKFYKSRAQTATSQISFPSAWGVVSRKSWYEVKYRNRDYTLLNAIRNAINWDLWPTLQNSWDAIPLSFVVDWFVDVEAMLKHIDRRIYEEYIDVLGVVYTYKDVYYPVLDYGGLTVTNFSLSFYRRRLRSHVHHGDFKVEVSHPKAINIADGAALIIQCKH